MGELLPLVVWIALVGSVGALQTKDLPVSKFPTQSNPKMLPSFPSLDKATNQSPVSAYQGAFDDEDWDKQWYAQDYRTTALPVTDLNLLPAYRLGYTGQGVVVAIVMDGIDPTHDDLASQFRHDIAYDMCDLDDNAYPDSPRDKIGTMAAGVIAMRADNRKCGVGVAYGAQVTAIKFWRFKWNRQLRARAVKFRVAQFDIALHPWGGGYMHHHDQEQEEAFQIGITKGRKGKGLIYVFTVGSDIDFGMSCWGTSQLQVPDVIAVNGATHAGKKLSYGEHCSAVMATAYALDHDDVPGVVTTIYGGKCGVQYTTGTWLAGAFAAGIIALVLNANENLTHRDVMHIITMGAEVAPLASNAGTWRRNAKGFWVSSDYGFGLFNAENMVNLAKTWENVPPKNVCAIKYYFRKPFEFEYGETKTISFEWKGCQNRNNAVNYLEHVVLKLNISYKYRGALQLNLVSPRGTNTLLIGSQGMDKSTDSISNWRVTSVQTWGEDPKGTWKLKILANGKPLSFWEMLSTTGFFNDFIVELHGTATAPKHYDSLPRSYAGFRLPNGQTSLDPMVEDELYGMDDVFEEPEIHPCVTSEDCDENTDNVGFVDDNDDNVTLETKEL